MYAQNKFCVQLAVTEPEEDRTEIKNVFFQIKSFGLHFYHLIHHTFTLDGKKR